VACNAIVGVEDLSPPVKSDGGSSGGSGGTTQGTGGLGGVTSSTAAGRSGAGGSTGTGASGGASQSGGAMGSGGAVVDGGISDAKGGSAGGGSSGAGGAGVSSAGGMGGAGRGGSGGSSGAGGAGMAGAGGGSVSAGIFCGSASCDPSTQVCCAESGALDVGSMIPLHCVPKGMCSGMAPMNIACDDHADCVVSQPTLPICCVGTSSGSPMGPFVLVECTTQGGCTTTATRRNEVMCSGANDRDSCPVGKTCRPGLLRDGYFTCQ
jgi:hypothetical protein